MSFELIYLSYPAVDEDLLDFDQQHSPSAQMGLYLLLEEFVLQLKQDLALIQII